MRVKDMVLTVYKKVNVLTEFIVIFIRQLTATETREMIKYSYSRRQKEIRQPRCINNI